MLNITENSIQDRISTERYGAFEKTDLPPAARLFARWMVVCLLIALVFLFLPWTQNIQSTGTITTLKPGSRPQTIHSTIDGRIEKWFVQEGAFVKAGDTIVHLSEIKAEYFDPQLLNRTNEQVEAKENSIDAYTAKAAALDEQVSALQKELILKREQLQNKINQAKLKIEQQEANFEQAKVEKDIADYQLRRTDTLYQKGIKSLTDLEGKRLKAQETKAKIVSAENKLLESKNDLEIAQLDLENVENDYANKIAKARSDKFTALSNRFDAQGSRSKLKNSYSNYEKRASFYYIVAPKDCIINQALKPGIGETIKAGEPIAKITPSNMELAVELYVRPMDLPLLKVGQEVSFIFDGWPAFIFSGWPDMSFGTFTGNIVAIDNNISENDRYRILVSSDNTIKPWPDALRPGSGAKGIALLNRVPLWYELWRKLNGFPPNYYTDKSKSPKLKAPAKSIK